MKVKLLTNLKLVAGVLSPGIHNIPDDELKNLPAGTFKELKDNEPVQPKPK